MHKVKHHFNKLKKLLKRHARLVLIIGIIIISLLLAFKFGILSLGSVFQSDSGRSGSISSEIEGIKATQSLDEQVQLYTKLLERVGPEKAQIELFESGLPFTGQTHLLNHTAGDYLYIKYGPAGLLQCKDFFLSSCYHGFILNAIADGGMPQVAKAFEECRKKGPAVSSQCAHAIGHGFLANVGYKNLIQALEVCDEALNTMPGLPAFNCYDGVFMENIWAVHDGAPSPDRWVNAGDMEYPCNDKRIDDKYILACWSNQPSLVFQFLQGDVGKVAAFCDKVERQEYQQMCFDSLSRQIHPLTQGESDKTFSLCGLMPSSEWNNFCVSVNAAASYAVGDRDVPFEICGNIAESGKHSCYGRLLGNIRAYAKPQEDFKKLCSKIVESDWRKKCEEMYL